MTRSARHRKKKKQQRRIIVGISSAISLSTLGLAQFPVSTYGLLLDQTSSESTFSAVFVFESTVNELVLRAQAAAERTNRLSQEIENLLASMNPISDPSVVDEVYTSSIKEESVTEAVYDLDQELSLDATVMQQVSEKEAEIQDAANEAWQIVHELRGYYTRALETSDRVLLYVEPALMKAEEAAQATQASIQAVEETGLQTATLNQYSGIMVTSEQRAQDHPKEEIIIKINGTELKIPLENKTL